MSIAVRMVPQSSEVKYYGRGREVSYPATAAPPLKAIEGRGLEGEEGGLEDTCRRFRPFAIDTLLVFVS